MRAITLRRSAPAGFVLVVACAAWLLTGVGVGDVVRFAAHELGFVLAPGCLVYAGLARPRPGPLKLVSIGYAVGSLLEILAFALTAALHVRWALWVYPPMVIGITLMLRRRGRDRPGSGLAAGRERAPEATPRGDVNRLDWVLAAICVAAIGYLAVAYFLFDPLPAQAGSVVYIPDLVFHLGVAAEALHHWPISDPKVAGAALPYETFVYMKLAAASQITHIPLPTIFFRLYALPLIVAIVALLTCAGSLVSGRRGIGLGAAVLFLFVGQLGLDSHDQLVFFNTVFFSLYDSPTYLFGLVVFLAALIALHDQLFAGDRSWPGWLLLGGLLVGCAGAKASILPDLLGGLTLYVLWQRRPGRGLRLRRGRRLGREPGLGRDRDPAAAIALLLTAVTFAVTYELIYHGGTGGLKLNPPGSIRDMSIVQFAESRLVATIGHPAFWVAAAVLGLIGFCGPTLAGIPAALLAREVRRAPSTTLLMSLLTASLLPFFLLTHKGGSQNFFTYYGICAGAILSAQGLAVMWDRAKPILSAIQGRLVVLAAGWLGVLIAAAVLPYLLARTPRIGPLYALWIGLPLLAFATLWGLAGRSAPRRGVLQAAAVGAVVLTGALDTPLHTGAAIVQRLEHNQTLYPSSSAQARGLVPGLQEALAWIARHTPIDAVIAVNNQYSDSRGRSPDYYYYSAFGERRIFLEGWEDTIAAASLNDPSITPFPHRLRLNQAVFYAADGRALRIMEREFGVRFLLVDRAHGPVDSRLAGLGRVVFSNRSAIVYRVT